MSYIPVVCLLCNIIVFYLLLSITISEEPRCDNACLWPVNVYIFGPAHFKGCVMVRCFTVCPELFPCRS